MRLARSTIGLILVCVALACASANWALSLALLIAALFFLGGG